MRTFMLALCWCALSPLARVDHVRAQDEVRPLALVNVTLIDGTGVAARPGMTVLVEGETITAVFATGDRTLPPAAEVRDLSGRYVIPGLINTHLHLPMLGSTRDSVVKGLERMLHAGVTTIREMAGDARLSAGLVRAVLAEAAPFPSIHYAARMAGPTFYEGGGGARTSIGFVPGTAPWAQAITADTDIALAVARAAGTGASGVKIYADLDTAVVRRIVEEAHRQGLKAWAHGTVFPTGPREAVRAGVDGLSHACMLFWGLQADVPRVRAEARPFDSDPTQLSGESFRNLLREMRTRSVVMDATARNASRSPGPRRAGCTPELLAATLRAMHEAGVPISTGTDYYIAEGEPDPTLFGEIEYLVESGVLSPLEAITAATLNGARAIGIESSHGTIEPGKTADLVVLSADPTADIGALRDVLAVMKAGRLYERSDYDAHRRQAAAEPGPPMQSVEVAGDSMADAARAPDLVARGDSLMELGVFDRAIEIFERAAALEPDRDVADGRVYQGYLALGLFDEATAWQARARERGGPVPYSGWWHCRLALTAIFRGDLEALEAQTDSLLATASDGAPDSWECAAFNEVFLRRYADARTHLSRYVALAKPEDMPLNLGFLHLRLGDDAEGERILGRAAARARAAAAEDPDSREPHFELAEIAAMRGEVDTALEHLEKAVARGLDREWWVFHLFSRDALPDPVFESLYEDPRFERIRIDILSERAQIRRRVVDRSTNIPLAEPAPPVDAQETQVPRTRTLPGIENPGFPYAQPEEVGLSSEKLQQLGEEIVSWVAAGDLVGAELLIVKDGRAVFHEAYGWSDREARRPVERNSIWSIKSMSKPFTATAILMLAEEGRLSLDDAVSRYLPGFAGDAGTTIRHLLSHTSGYRDEDLGDPRYYHESFGHWVEDWASTTPTGTFGEYEYTDFGFAAAGYIVEKVTGVPIGRFTEQRIVRPLGLEDTSTDFSDDPAWRARLNPWYRWNEEGGGYELRWTVNFRGWQFYPAAWGMFSTAMDYAEFMSLWLNRGEREGLRLLPEETVEEALQPHALVNGYGMYGYGWFVSDAPGNGDGMPLLFDHGGGDGTWAMAIPESNAIVIYLTHSRAGSHISALANRIGMLGLFDHPGPGMLRTDEDPVAEIELSPEERARYVGTWAAGGPEGGISEVPRVWEEDGRLRIRLGRGGAKAEHRFDLVPLAGGRFALGRYENGELAAFDPIYRIRFVEREGAVSTMELMEGDRVLFAAEPVDPAGVRARIDAERDRVSLAQIVSEVLETHGIEAARARHRALLAARPDSVRFGESLLNTVGYRLLTEDRVEEAIAVFEMNVEAHPDAANRHDSLGDAYRVAGRLQEARRSYERAVELAEQQEAGNLSAYRAKLDRLIMR